MAPKGRLLSFRVQVLTGWRLSQDLTSLSCLSVSLSYVKTDGQLATLSRNKALIWGLRPDFYYCQSVAGLLMWDALTDERTGLSFTIAAVFASTVILGSIFYCLRFETSFSSPPMTLRTAVEVFDPVRVRDTLRLAVYRQSVRLDTEPLETHGVFFFNWTPAVVVLM
jgi:hypothetical protein